MAICYTCGNDYEDTFRVEMGGKTFDFDSFECAAHALAPSCSHCGCRILGHGLQYDDIIFCCGHCAKESGAKGLVDHEHTSVIVDS